MEKASKQQAEFMLAGDQTVGEFNFVQACRYADHMLEEVNETKRDLASGDYVKAIDGAVDTIVVAIGFLHSIGVDPFQAWNAVHAANMSKLVDGKVYRRTDGQIGKGPNFKPPEPELAELWDKVKK